MRLGLPSTSFKVNTIKPYFIGDIYCIHPIHMGISELFLKNPENNINGKSIIGTTAATDFASRIALPINSPSEAPAKDNKK